MKPARPPSYQFYPGDWRRDLGLQSCGLRARGLWQEMTCLMHEGEPYGHLTTPAGAMSPEMLAKHVREPLADVKHDLAELERQRVFSRTPGGVIFSRRMVRDQALRESRAAGGPLGAEHGIKGGRPRKRDEGVTQGVTQGGRKGVSRKTPLPLQSSSSSASARGGAPPPIRGGSAGEPVRSAPKPTTRGIKAIRIGRTKVKIPGRVRPVVDVWAAGFVERFGRRPEPPKPWDLTAVEDLVDSHGVEDVLLLVAGAMRVGTKRMRDGERWSLQAIQDDWNVLVAMQAKGELR